MDITAFKSAVLHFDEEVESLLTKMKDESAIGIIDSDLKNDEECEKLKRKNIFTLKCNEIEMLLLDEDIIRVVLGRFYEFDEGKIETFKEAFFRKLSDRKEHMVRRLVKTYVDLMLSSANIDDKNNKTREELEASVKDVFERIDIEKAWQEYETKIETIISEKKYEEGLRYCCLEHSEVIRGLGNTLVPNYAEIALGALKNEEELSQCIREKYFPEIVM